MLQMQDMYVGEGGLMVFCDRFVAITGFCFFLGTEGYCDRLKLSPMGRTVFFNIPIQ
ncbi:hypothetical protein [Calothrix sp. NIES-3974]|uniref:hypothetical protein n=1 Tax=Calothrix sp. NIES-3974 TaxID=2005462 RepID=UPI001560943A|nr:hypothetical protein [Calothrix sp. NIES-3974]